MKKKILFTILSLVFAFTCMLGLAACNGTTVEGYQYSKYGDDELCVTVNNVRYLRKQKDATYFYVYGTDPYSTDETFDNILTEIDGLPVTHIGSLSGHHKVKSITVPEGIKTIGSIAFMYDDALETITLPDSLTSIGARAFFECKSLKSITIPNNVTEIGERLFDSCYKLESVTLPGTIKDIPKETFYNCNSLTNVTLNEGIQTIGEEAFSWKSKLTSITLPTSMKKIGKKAFENCSHLKTISFPSNMEEVEEGAFRNCSALQTIAITNKAMKLSSSAFSVDSFTASSISKIYFEGSTAEWEDFVQQNELKFPPTKTDITVYCSDGEVTIKEK